MRGGARGMQYGAGGGEAHELPQQRRGGEQPPPRRYNDDQAQRQNREGDEPSGPIIERGGERELAMRGGTMPLRGHRGGRGQRVLRGRGGGVPQSERGEPEGDTSTEQQYSEAPAEQRRYNNESKA